MCGTTKFQDGTCPKKSCVKVTNAITTGGLMLDALGCHQLVTRVFRERDFDIRSESNTQSKGSKTFQKIPHFPFTT
jgi:hypothetical protein